MVAVEGMVPLIDGLDSGGTCQVVRHTVQRFRAVHEVDDRRRDFFSAAVRRVANLYAVVFRAVDRHCVAGDDFIRDADVYVESLYLIVIRQVCRVFYVVAGNARLVADDVYAEKVDVISFPSVVVSVALTLVNALVLFLDRRE